MKSICYLPLSCDLFSHCRSLTQNNAVGLLWWLPHNPHRRESHLWEHKPHGWAWGWREKKTGDSGAAGMPRGYTTGPHGGGLCGLAEDTVHGRVTLCSGKVTFGISVCLPNDFEKMPHFESSSSAFQAA